MVIGVEEKEGWEGLSSLVCCEHTEDKPELVLIVSPSWLSPGASVTLRCEVKPPSAGWVFYWYKAVPDISQRNYRYELLPDSIRGTVEDFYIIHGQRNTAGYACRAGRGNQEYLTDYSEQKIVWSQGLKSQSKRALLTPPRPPSRRGRIVSDKLTASSGVDPSAKTISVPVFHLYHKLLPGQPLPPEMTLAQLLTLLYDRKLPQGYQSINLTVKLGSKVISDPGLSKTDSFKRLRTEKGTKGQTLSLGSNVHFIQ
ncbi:hypothetical protein AMECASPLE_027939 [Ameca splendens]|uniref:Ig-like domain-containing protein n=1 Tax=Ameca splendens TaxID=208324 RepID=A0ABV1A3C4_9TELE